VHADVFAEQLFDDWCEGPVRGEREAGEGVRGGLETPCQRAGVVGFRGGDLLGFEHAGPEVMRFLRLGDALRSQARVGPSHSAVAFFLGPVALEGLVLCDDF